MKKGKKKKNGNKKKNNNNNIKRLSEWEEKKKENKKVKEKKKFFCSFISIFLKTFDPLPFYFYFWKTLSDGLKKFFLSNLVAFFRFFFFFSLYFDNNFSSHIGSFIKCMSCSVFSVNIQELQLQATHQKNLIAICRLYIQCVRCMSESE